MDRPATARAPTTRPIGREDDVLAMIVRNIAVPANELGVGTPPAAPPSAAEPAPTTTPPAAAAKPAPTPEPKVVPERALPVAASIAAPKKPADSKVATAKKSDPKTAEAKDARKADGKSGDAKKSDPAKVDAKKADAKKADAKKTDAKKGDAKKPEPKKPAEPARWWVQVAGGANVADLPKAWSALTAKNPALKKRQAWTTPLRFTNRLLTGPFASSAEAQTYVNTLGKDGLSAFAFQSEAGQKVTRLPAK